MKFSTVDESFPYGSNISTPDTNFVNESEKSAEDSIDLSGFDFEKPKGARKRNKFKSLAAADSSIDLTDESFEISPPKRSRRAADNVDASIVDTVEIGDSPAVITRTRSGCILNKTPVSRALKEAKKAPIKASKTKRVTYKQALALAKAPIPGPLVEQPKPKEVTLRRATEITARSVPSAPPVDSCDIDLTGDIVLTDKHSSAPLFQKLSSTNNKPVESDDSEDDEDLLNYDIDSVRIKVHLEKGIKAYNYKRHQRYYDLVKTIAEQENIPINNIFLFDHDKRLLYDDTPNSTGYKISTFLTCRVMEIKPGELQMTSKMNQIVIKFQSDKWKKPIAVKISKFDSLKTAIDVLCQQMPQFKINQFSLQFDGDDVSVNDTPTDLEFDGGEILDCRVKV